MVVGTRRWEGVAGRLRPLVRRGPPLASVPARVGAALDRAAARATRRVVLLAVDGLRADVARERWSPDDLAELCTTVPSASTPAWLTATTGAGVGEHLVAGMVFATPAAGGLVHAAGTGHAAPGAHDLVRPHATIFDSARAREVEPVALPGALAAWPGPWLDALLSGAERDTGAERRSGAGALEEARTAVAGVDAVLRERAASPLLVWAYVDLDTAVHARGYDGDVLAAVDLLGEAAERWAGAGAEVLAVSDHGLVPVEYDAEATAAWHVLEHGPLCRMPSGGAGRMRWLYARPGSEQELLREAAVAFEDLALVATPEELAGAGLLDLTPHLRPRLGDVVAVATHPRFPVPDPSFRWEHGGLDPEEMLVPWARWGGGDPDGTAT